MKKIAIAGAGACLTLGVIAGPIVAASAAPSRIIAHGLRVTATHTTNVRVGQVVSVHVSGATKNAPYYCLEAVGIPGSKTLVAPYVGTLSTPNSSARGTLTCNIKYVHFTAKTIGGAKSKVSCPPTRAEKRKGYVCEVTVADGATKGKAHNATVTFTTKN